MIHEVILSLPPGVQRQVVGLALRSGRIWAIPQFACLKRWFVLSGADERAMDHAVRHCRSWDGWTAFWLEHARRTRIRAEGELACGHRVTARERFHAAAVADAMALWPTHDLAGRERIYPQLRADFQRFADLTTPPLVALDVPFDPAPLPAQLRLPRAPAAGERLPAVVLVQGMDTIKETLGCIEDALLQRGLATLTLEQPGSGEARRRGVCLTGPDALEAAAHAVADVAGSRPELDPGRLGLYGVSYGGFVAPYFAAVEPRYTALAVLGAMWEFPHPRGMAANPFYGAIMRLMTGVEDGDEVARIFEQLTLGPVAGRIAAATAILHGKTDRLLVDGARRLHTAIHADTRLRVIEGGDHALTWHPEEHAFLADWLADHLHA